MRAGCLEPVNRSGLHCRWRTCWPGDPCIWGPLQVGDLSGHGARGPELGQASRLQAQRVLTQPVLGKIAGLLPSVRRSRSCRPGLRRPEERGARQPSLHPWEQREVEPPTSPVLTFRPSAPNSPCEGERRSGRGQGHGRNRHHSPPLLACRGLWARCDPRGPLTFSPLRPGTP